ncbi:hypothetical protein C7N43_19340 [Sphingobacteriales bacterium UPWRP_1]|nr:hypothetical protein BVG80_13675 [Sphingobacteriales bacterium TSM_CSM]PSJ75373.1 hypothetical protein C7N43_19340 [Sphingobacteriales bacterium UPWRP_1]
MNKCKTFYLLLFFVYFCFPFPTQIMGQWSEYCFNFRWVDNNAQFYTQGFTIPYFVHENVDNYFLDPPPTCPDEGIGPGCSINSSLFPFSIATAAMTWNNAGAFPWFQAEGIANGEVVSNTDNANVIGFDPDAFDPNNKTTLAFCKLHQSGEAYVCNNPDGTPNPDLAFRPTVTLQGFDIAINNNIFWDILEGINETDLDYACYDFESVALHEFGHALGLCHAASACTGLNKHAMCGNINNAEIRRNLQPEDIAALKALYPPAPPYPPCDIFRPDQGVDKATKQSGNTGSGSTCYYIPPGAFSVEATRQMVLFWERELGNNFNLLMRRFVQNTAVLNHILTVSDSRYAGVQTGFSNALTTLTPLIERNFAQNDSTKITAAHINAVCCWVDELLPLFNEVEFYREPLFLQELLNLQKGLNSLLNKDARTALLHYDNITDFSGLGACSCSGKRRMDDTMNFYISAQQGYISLHSQLPQEATLQYLIYDTGGKMSGSIIAGQLPAGKHTENIQRGVLKTGLYIIVPVIDGLPLRSNALKVSAF